MVMYRHHIYLSSSLGGGDTICEQLGARHVQAD